MRIRRARAIAPWNGGQIARLLLRRKIEGQASVLARLSGAGAAVDVVRGASEALQGAEDAEQLRWVEAQAAAVYWGAWASVSVRFARKDEAKIPQQWATFDSRSSPLTNSPRRAANPANALLNYLYAILEVEARIACLALGLDPGMGVLHADQRNRDSLACDLMEAIRPEVDAAVLDLLASHTFAASDCFETRQGDCRLLSPMTQRLAETAPQWSKAIAPVAEEVAHLLFEAYEALPSIGSLSPQAVRTASGVGRARKASALATPLTQAHRSAGRGRQRRRPEVDAGLSLTVLPNGCQGCGVPLDDAEAGYCDACRDERRREFMPDFTASGPEALARRRAAGDNPAHGGEARAKRSTRHVEQMRASAEWEEVHGDDDRGDLDFARDILPGLEGISLVDLMQATGLSRRYCWRIRRGETVPYPRHWDALRMCARQRHDSGHRTSD